MNISDLPRELSEDQRTMLVTGFMAHLTGGAIPWYAAIHQTGKDALNPHVHIVIHDRDVNTGKRVLRLSDNARDREKAKLPGPKAVEWVRERWELACNAALEAAGVDARIDRRTLQAQGIDREPTIHEGPRAQHINDHVRTPKSQSRINGCGRVIDYPSIDHGKTRREFNAYVIDINLQKAARSSNPAKAMWAMFEKEQAALDVRLENRLIAEQRKRTLETRKGSLTYMSRIAQMRGDAVLELRDAIGKVRAKYDPMREKLSERHAQERLLLKNKQSRLYLRIIMKVDFTGITRRRQEAARKTLSAAHKVERDELSARRNSAGQAVKAMIKERCAGQIATERRMRASFLQQLGEIHRRAEAFADFERQQREKERDHMRRLTEAKLEKAREREKSGTKTSSTDFGKAIFKTAKQEAQRPEKNHRKDRDFER